MLARWQELSPLHWLGNRELPQELSGWFDALLSDNRRFGNWQFNLTQEDDRFIVRIALPGFDPESIEAEVLGDFLTVRAERRLEEPEEGAHYLCRERSGEHFEETIRLPGKVNAETVNARYVNGVLTITLPREEALKPQSIKVEAK